MTALGYAILGMLLGIYMASSKNHGQLVTHAHIMLIGFVVSFAYAVIYKVWLTEYSHKLAMLQFALHSLGTILIVIGLFCLYGQWLPEPTIGPILGIASILVLSAMVVMKVQFIKQAK